MRSFWDKVKIFGGGEANAFIDDKIDGNINSYKEQVRQFAQKREEFQSALSQQQYRLDTMNGELKAEDLHAQDLMAKTQALQAANGGKPNEAQQAEMLRNAAAWQTLQDGRADHVAKIETQRQLVQQMQEGVQATASKEAEYKAKIAELSSAAVQTKASEGLTKTLTGMKEATDGIDSTSGIGDKINEKRYVASANLQRALGAMASNDHAESDKIGAQDALAKMLGTSKPTPQAAA